MRLYRGGPGCGVQLPELPGLDRDAIREWYNGYCWRGEEKVYNPFDILLLLRNREFRAWWFETGTPTFLVEPCFGAGSPRCPWTGCWDGDDLLSAFDVDDIATEALLFQTGYLTITAEENLGGNLLYRLGYPNREVRQEPSNESLLRYLVKDATAPNGNQVAGVRCVAGRAISRWREVKPLSHWEKGLP